jgi:hypothetical protein
MDMAQRYVEQGRLFNGSSYVTDILKQYGNGGKPMRVPQINNEAYEQGLKFRHAEKQHYAGLEKKLSDANSQIVSTRQELHSRDVRLAYLNAYVDEFLKVKPGAESDDIVHSGSSGSGTGIDHRGNVLPPKNRPNENDTAPGKPEAIISGMQASEASDELANARTDRTDRSGDEERNESVDAPAGTEQQTGGAITDVGGPSCEHSAA